jgi:curved DNA-binding protein CbpA
LVNGWIDSVNISKALEILGLASSPSRSEIKKAYREQVKLWHPDRYSDGSAIKKIAEKNIQDANLAYALLKRNLPAIPKDVSLHPSSRPIRQKQISPRSRANYKLIDRGIQLLEALRQRFPRLHFRPVLEWLQHDAQNHYRPWYRYPPTSSTDKNHRERVSFDQALQNAMENRSQIKGIHRMHRSRRHDIQEDTVAPIDGVSKPVKSNRK